MKMIFNFYISLDTGGEKSFCCQTVVKTEDESAQ